MVHDENKTPVTKSSSGFTPLHQVHVGESAVCKSDQQREMMRGAMSHV